MTLSYALDISHLNNFYASINYQIDGASFDYYIGAVLGVSTLNWEQDPFYVLIDKSLTSESMIYGLQIGLKKEFKEHWAYTAKYQYFNYNHVLDIRNGRDTINHTAGNNLLLGVQYEF